jgi:hypothetical protein
MRHVILIRRQAVVIVARGQVLASKVVEEPEHVRGSLFDE